MRISDWSSDVCSSDLLACDLAVAEDKARFALPEVKVGLYAAAGGVQRLTRQLGRKVAMELILTGRHFEAAEAVALGVLHQRCNDGGALPTARASPAQQLSTYHPLIRAPQGAGKTGGGAGKS